MSTPKILVIDDDAIARKFIGKALSDSWEHWFADSGEAGIAMAEQHQPSVILLDIEMPGMDGYGVCKALKQNPRTREIPIIFISSLSSVDKRLEGYEVGADDFMQKPFQAAELEARLSVLLRYRSTHDELNEKVATVSSAAMAALRGSGELGMAVQFIEQSYRTVTLEELARRFLQVTSSLKLRCSLMFKSAETLHFYGDRGDLAPIERDLIQALHQQEKRFIDFGTRTQINYPQVALLVKNMPLDDPESYGRYKDFLPTMLGTTDAKVRSIDTEKGLITQTENLIAAFGNVKDTLLAIADSISENQKVIGDCINTELGQIEERVPKLGLDDDQERFLMQSIDSTLNQVGSALERGESIRQSLQMVPLMLKAVSDSQEALLERVRTPRDTGGDLPDENAAIGAIDLF